MLGTETRWSLVVLRKAIFSREFSSPFLKKHSQAVQQLPCAAPQTAAGSLPRRRLMRRLSHTVLCCESPEKAAVTAAQACSPKMATCEWTWANQRQFFPYLCTCKGEGCEYPLPSPSLPVACPVAALLWKPKCCTLYHPQRSQESHLVQPPTCLVLLICLLRQAGEGLSWTLRLTPSTGV